MNAVGFSGRAVVRRAATLVAVTLVLALLSIAGPGTASAQLCSLNSPCSIAIVSGNNQTGTVGSPLPAPLVVRVQTASLGTASFPVAGVTVTWSVISGSGTLGSFTSVTDSKGEATNTFNPGAPTSQVRATITAPGGFSSSSVTFTENANPAFNYSLAANPANVAVIAGGPSGATTITATLVSGATQPVSFSVSGLPAGATATFSQVSCSPTCAVTVTLAAGAATQTGTSTITVTGSPLGRTTTFTLTVSAPFDYSLSANPVSVTVTAGGASGTATITATLVSGATQPVSFSASGLPAGATATFSQASCSPTCSVTLTLSAGAATAPGTTSISITGNPLGRTTTVRLTVNAAASFDYSLAANPGTVSVAAGGPSASTTITATLLVGPTQNVGFTVSGLPAGVSAAFSLPACSPTCSVTLSVTAGVSATQGTSIVTVTGNPLGRTTTFTLVVSGARTLSIVSGNNQLGIINSTLPKPLVVAVTPPNPSVTVIWEVTGGAIPSASSTPTSNGLAQINLTLGPTPGSVSVTARISGAGIAGSSVTFFVNDATPAAIAGLNTYHILGNLALATTTVQNSNIGIRLAALRRGTTGGVSVSGLSVNVAGQPVPLEAVTSTLGGGASGDGASPFGNLGIFLNGQGSFGDQDGTSREPGFKFNTQGMTLGSDYRVTENIVLGAAFGYLHTSADLDSSGGKVKMNGYSLSLFGSYYVADKFYVDMISTYGWNGYDVVRNIVFADTGLTARSDPDARQFSISVSGGYNFSFGALTVGPTARATYINIHIDGFQERGADIFNLKVGSQKIESMATDLGGQISYAISTSFGVLTPLARAEWEHEFLGGNRLISGSLLADPLRTTFTSPGNDPARDYANLAVGVTGTFPRGLSAFLHYETVLGRTNVTNHSFTGGIRYQFE